MFVRVCDWRPIDVAFDNLEQLNRELDRLYETGWLRLKANGEIDETASSIDPGDPYVPLADYDEKIAELIAAHLKAGQVFFALQGEYDERWGWLVQPGQVVPLRAELEVRYYTPESELVEKTTF